jgi:3-methyladenine DNA glycosylase Mpg
MAARRGSAAGPALLTAPMNSAARVRLGRALCAGPARLCQAFGLTRTQNGLDLTAAPLWISPGPDGPVDPGTILATRRIGISRGVETLWRFTVRGDPYVSGPLRANIAQP